MHDKIRKTMEFQVWPGKTGWEGPGMERRKDRHENSGTRGRGVPIAGDLVSEGKSNRDMMVRMPEHFMRRDMLVFKC